MAEVEKFLVVDDDDSTILFFQVLLSELGKESVQVAKTGDHAISLANTMGVHFIISAWEMSPMSGTVFLQRMRNNRKFRHIPCVLYSKRMSQEDVNLTKDLGLKNVLGMPFDKKAAKDLITSLIEKEESLDPLEKKLRKIEGFIGENKPAEALKIVDPSVTKKSPFRPRVYTALGEIWIAVNNQVKAKSSLETALAEDPAYLPALYSMAKLYTLQGDHERAIELLNQASEKSPNNIKTLLNLGRAYQGADRLEEADEALKKAGALDAENKQLADEKGVLAFRKGNIELATQLLAETENGDEIARHFNNMAISLVAEGKFPNGIETYQNAIKVISDKAKTHLLNYNLGLAYRKSKNLERAFKVLADAYLEEPSFEKAYVALARTHKDIIASGKSPNKEIIHRVKKTRAAFKNPEGKKAG